MLRGRRRASLPWEIDLGSDFPHTDRVISLDEKFLIVRYSEKASRRFATRKMPDRFVIVSPGAAGGKLQTSGLAGGDHLEILPWPECTSR